jgi:tetratricopeptide (TPR) repeat protein
VFSWLGCPRVFAFSWLLIAGGIAVAIPAAQTPHTAHRIPVVPEELVTRAVPLRQGIGRAHDAVSTTSKEAQAFYDQGLAYLHSYVWIEAARSFNQALRVDPKLAMAHIGLSYAYLELNSTAAARAALDRARALEGAASDHDRRHIAARAAQMLAEAVPGDQSRLTAYRAELDRAVQQFPGDAELWLLRGIAESPDPSDRGQGSPLAAVKHFERALTASAGHFAAHHYLTHAFENAGRSADALEHAAAYAAAANQVPHALHMHGHVLRRQGRIDEAVAIFERADRLETSYFKIERVAAELDWHYEHNLDLLGSSYLYLGQVARAEQTLKAAFDLPSALVVQMVNKRVWPQFLISRNRVAEAQTAAATLAAHAEPLVRATGHISAGHAHLAAGRFKEAAAAANAALKELKASPAGAGIVATAFETLQGEFFLRTRQAETGRAMLREAVRQLREAPGPDNWVQALFAIEGMARAARAAGDWEFAAWLAGEMRTLDPRYGGTHYALALAAEHNGNTAAARAAFAEAERLWSKADAALAELQDIRSRGK